jgi:dienelactone hydrolase
VLIHIADGDAINPPTLAAELNEKISADTGRNPEIDHYPAGHAFLNEEDLLETFARSRRRSHGIEPSPSSAHTRSKGVCCRSRSLRVHNE